MDSELVVIRIFLNHFDAELAKATLEAGGIDSMIRSDDCGGMRPHLWMSGVELLVRSEDATEADEILSNDARIEPLPFNGRSIQ